MKQNVFLYDGDCEFCSGLASKLAKLSLDQNVKFVSFRDLSSQDLKDLHPSLETKLVEGNVQLISGNTRYPGFFAVRKLSHSLKGWRWISPLLYLPLVPLLGMFFMSLLKSIRSKI
ncbi:DCC1-like thiol-disulfide oxidoreductase family protein [Leptospira venezuelensis]|uniref:DCC1-like thiol-disulfide oxidoreductase family protein n=1 Tax=Leptospira venezuelensis TaxID=1958811 RepID=UPI000A386E11|nr:DCC1-like thiol-disulfide oxidoreductase family protein [Leptospira venezuelensis]